MRNLKARCRFASSVLVLALTLNALAQDPRYAELPNFHQVSSQLCRGAQPGAGGLQRLKAIGIKTIVNLRREDARTQAEGDGARALGLRYYSVPLPGFSAPQDKDVHRALDIINAPENQPVFVHCRHGEDRTGTIIACYRITHDGWTAAQAKKEAEGCGMSWTQVGMKRYIDKFYKQRQKPATGTTRIRKIQCLKEVSL
jgi:protein tyrosine/serine phosphatase